MGEHPKSRAPQLARTDFESMTHEQLAALLHSANTAGASHLAAKLSKAASTISRIGSDLMEHVKGLEWQGEGGDSFRDWGGQTASATLHLGQYAEVASRWMETVSQAIAEAKAAMPDTSETARAKTDLADAHKTITALQQPGVHNDPDAQQAARTAHSDATAAQHRIDAARHEAVQQLRKLAQTYEYSAQQVNSVPPPTFSPPANHVKSQGWFDSPQHISVDSETPAGGSGTSVGRTTSVHSTGQHDNGQRVTGHLGTTAVGSRAPSEHASAVTHPLHPVAMGIDTVGTIHRAPDPTTAGPGTPLPASPRPEPPLVAQPPASPPLLGGGGRVSAPPSVSTPRVPSSSASSPSVTPGGTVAGRAPRVPRESGIIGGRPVSSGSGQPQNGIGRGTVIGREGVQGRTGVPGMQAAHGVSAGGPGTARGASAGRRLASETGGVIGSRQIQPNRSGGRPFTPGGSGLVRPSSGAVDPSRGSVAGRTQTPTTATRPSGSRKDRQQDERPDYLVEDESTWVRDDRRALPPVVD
ncbi:hypothetical protein ACH4C2_34585 [Streptomyces sp. NPDC018057]|uniref:hypothetical protein n=1 Tax=unclassified Streptomyces TaxID=2593676 RepID=UPI0037A35CA8